MKTHNILLAGVGGQGIILAGRVIAACAFNAGQSPRKSEVHGMAQRGGAIVSHLRFGGQVHSSLIPPGHADIILALEELEGLRNLAVLRPGGLVILNRRQVPPRAAASKDTPYPEDIPGRIRQAGATCEPVDAPGISRELGEPRVENIVLVGALSRHLPFSRAQWAAAVEEAVAPKLAAVNLAAFDRGAAPAENGNA